ncbi:DNA cytosine methyltransferase [Lacinutrix chionoecetis]
MTKKIKVIDLFAGAGGFGLGFEMAKYHILFSLEVDKWASDTLRENFNHKVIHDSILNYTSKKDITALCTEQPDIIIGGPPCQGFSNAGKKVISDPRNKMYLHFHKWVDVLKPKMFVIENVKGILNFKTNEGTKVIDEIKSKFSNSGYSVNIWKLNSKNYGVPQSRERIFIVGHIDNIVIPKPPIINSNDENSNLPQFLTVNDAISDLPKIKAKEGSDESDYDSEPQNDYQKKCRINSSKVFNHEAMKHTDRMVSRYQHIIDGNSLDDLSDELKVRKRNGNGELSNIKFALNYRYLKPNHPSYTIPAHFYSSFIHPSIPRNITTREAARIQSFPDWYKFCGKRTMISSKLLKRLGKDEELNHLSQYNQVGNAVPPLLAKNIAIHLKKFFD